ncbi:AraC family transcriptional regulator [Clostridium sp. AWRP]|uniref:helix-turn-helix domain-containing protein n=1 Tax=Clostridium sp. AWRP TaxID=2212991 RepID=UPI000FD77FEE|nr:AraC family transcriptional regulator [Clostridium sp. AWRP]AZV56398.1 helix-turn-helix domain-containing protein [Clostridium sp. AWRP]
MKKATKKLVEPCLTQLGFNQCFYKDSFNLSGRCYEISKELGKGYYWYYEREEMFSIGIMDIRLYKDTLLEYTQPDYISVTYFDTVSAEELNPYKRLTANCIRGYISEGNYYRVRYHKSVPIHGVELMLMPKYYSEYLKKRFPDESFDSKTAFLGIDGISEFPELVLLMRQIESFRGTGASADLFYESKIKEAVSLIIEKTKKCTRFVSTGDLSKKDLENLDAVKSYIADHFAFNIHTEQLIKIACMSQTKLRYTFKKTFGYTITEYIQNKRMAYAEYLILETDFSIGQIAKAVGYSHAGRFASLFKKNTGLLPEEYRNLLKNIKFD